MSLDEISYAYSCQLLPGSEGSVESWVSSLDLLVSKTHALTVCYSTRYVGAFKPLLSEDHVIVGHFISPSLSNFLARNGKRREEGRTEGGREGGLSSYRSMGRILPQDYL